MIINLVLLTNGLALMLWYLVNQFHSFDYVAALCAAGLIVSFAIGKVILKRL